MIYLRYGFFDKSTNILLDSSEFDILEIPIYFPDSTLIPINNPNTFFTKEQKYVDEFNTFIRPAAQSIFNKQVEYKYYNGENLFEPLSPLILRDTTTLELQLTGFIHKIDYYNKIAGKEIFSQKRLKNIFPMANLVVVKKYNIILNCYLFQYVFQDGTIFIFDSEELLNKYLILYSDDIEDYNNLFINVFWNNNLIHLKDIDNTISLAPIIWESNKNPSFIWKFIIKSNQPREGFRFEAQDFTTPFIFNNKYFAFLKEINDQTITMSPNDLTINTFFKFQFADITHHSTIPYLHYEYNSDDFVVLNANFYFKIKTIKFLNKNNILLWKSKSDEYKIYPSLIQHPIFYDFMTQMDKKEDYFAKIKNFLSSDETISYAGQYLINNKSQIKLSNLLNHFYNNYEYLIGSQIFDKNSIYYNSTLDIQVYFSDIDKMAAQNNYLRINGIVAILENQFLKNTLILASVLRKDITNLIMTIKIKIIDYDTNQYNSLDTTQITSYENIIVLQPIHLFNIIPFLDTHKNMKLKNFVFFYNISLGYDSDYPYNIDH